MEKKLPRQKRQSCPGGTIQNISRGGFFRSSCTAGSARILIVEDDVWPNAKLLGLLARHCWSRLAGGSVVIACRGSGPEGLNRGLPWLRVVRDATETIHVKRERRARNTPPRASVADDSKSGIRH